MRRREHRGGKEADSPLLPRFLTDLAIGAHGFAWDRCEYITWKRGKEDEEKGDGEGETGYR